MIKNAKQKSKETKQNVIRKSARLLSKLDLNRKSIFGSILVSKNRRSERLMIKQKKIEFEYKTVEKKRKFSIKKKIDLNESEMIDIDCSRRLAKKVIARNNL